MERELNYNIQDARRGLQEIMSRGFYQALINNYPLTEEALIRIRDYPFLDQEPFFFAKREGLINPAKTLYQTVFNNNNHFKQDETVIKWFFLLQCISSAANLYKEKILIESAALREQEYLPDFDLYEYHYEDILRYVDDTINTKQIVYRCFPHLSNINETLYRDGFYEDGYFRNRSDIFRMTIAVFALTAGYHAIHDSFIVPNNLRNREIGLPFILSSALYVSIMTGGDFYETLRNLLKTMGHEYQLDDVISKTKTIIARKALDEERERLTALLTVNNEELRQNKTASEIASASYGSGLSLELIQERINKCNDKEHRKLLYHCESLLGKKLSFLDKIELIDSYIETVKSDYGVFFSDKETAAIVTVEDFIDTILCHKKFLGCFISLTLDESFPEVISEDDPYDFETRFKELELIFGAFVNMDSIHSIEDIKRTFIDNNPVIDALVSLIKDKLDIDASAITFNAHLANDLGADSLDAVELLMEAEKRYGIKISDEETFGIRTVGDIYRLVVKKISRRGLNS